MLKAIIGRRPGRTGWEIVVGPEKTRDQRRAFWNGLRFDKLSRNFAEVAMMESSSRKKLSGTRANQEIDSSSSFSSSSSSSSLSSQSSASSVNSSSSSSSSVNSSSSSSSTQSSSSSS